MVVTSPTPYPFRASAPGAPEDAGEMIDAEAKAAYGRRLEQAREELEQAKELGNTERVAKAEDEIDAISRELSRVIGRGGRHRRAGSASERARLRVTNAIKVAIERVARTPPARGASERLYQDRNVLLLPSGPKRHSLALLVTVIAHQKSVSSGLTHR